MAKAQKKYALDISRTLRAIDNHDMTYFDNLTDDERKGYHSPVVMRFVSSDEGALADWNLLAVNEKSNMYHYSLYEYPDLNYKLLASVGLGIKANHKWIANSPKGSSTGINKFIQQYWPEANALEMNIILRHLKTGDNLTQFLNGTGLATEEIKRIEKLFG